MADGHFFDLEGDSMEEIDDFDYDSLNNETFGNAECSDWEENHQNLASQLENFSFNDKNSEIGERIASFVLEDEGDEHQQCQASNNVAPQPSFNKGDEHTQCQASNNVAPQPSFNKFITVEEIEAKYRAESTRNHENSRGSSQHVLGDPSKGAIPKRPDPNFDRLRGRMHPMYPSGPHPRHAYMHPPHQRYAFHANRHPRPLLHRPPYDNSARPNFQEPINPARRQFHSRRQYSGPHMPPHMQPGHIPGSNFEPPMPQHLGCGLANGHPDEYRGLMTIQEKNWLGSIQTMQLNSNQPANDYYFLMFNQRHQARSRANDSSSPTTGEVPLTRSTYKPLQYENSLGKLQAGSVSAPRKIIDVVRIDGAPTEPCKHKPNDTDAELKRKKKKKHIYLLIEIEELMNIQLQIEDLFNPLFCQGISKVIQEKNLQILTDKMLKALLKDDKLVSIMSGTKGKKLVLRLLPYLPTPGPIIYQIIMNLDCIAKKDSEQIMLRFLPLIRSYLNWEPATTMADIISRYSQQFLFSNQFMVSVVANLVERAGQCLENNPVTSTEEVETWKNTINKLGETIMARSDVERPVVAVEREAMLRLLALIKEDRHTEQCIAIATALSNIRADSPCLS